MCTRAGVAPAEGRGWKVFRLRAEQLRRRVERGAHRAETPALRRRARVAEVAELRHALRDEDVGRGDVEVEDPPPVQEAEGGEDAARQLDLGMVTRPGVYPTNRFWGASPNNKTDAFRGFAR